VISLLFFIFISFVILFYFCQFISCGEAFQTMTSLDQTVTSLSQTLNSHSQSIARIEV